MELLHLMPVVEVDSFCKGGVKRSSIVDAYIILPRCYVYSVYISRKKLKTHPHPGGNSTQPSYNVPLPTFGGSAFELERTLGDLLMGKPTNVHHKANAPLRVPRKEEVPTAGKLVEPYSRYIRMGRLRKAIVS